MKKQKWYDNEKDLATKPIFNIAWFGVWCFSLIIGAKGVAYQLGWESYILGIFSFLMLALQIHWFTEILEVHNARRIIKKGRKGK